MKITITSERDLADDAYEDYIKSLNSIGIRINAEEFKKTKMYQYSDDMGYTRVTTTYRIVDDDKH
jgi:hypothetical protein